MKTNKLFYGHPRNEMFMPFDDHSGSYDIRKSTLGNIFILIMMMSINYVLVIIFVTLNLN